MTDNKPASTTHTTPATTPTRAHAHAPRPLETVAARLKTRVRPAVLALAALWLVAVATTTTTLAPAQNTQAPAAAAAPASSAAAAPAPAATATPAPANADCLACHADGNASREINGKTQTLDFPAAAFEKSVHAGLSCVDCHTDIKEAAHEPGLAPVNCAQCHEDAAKACAASVHGAVGNTRAARSAEPPPGENAKKNLGAPRTTPGAAAPTVNREPGTVNRGGSAAAPATCADCHGTHDIAPPTTTTSALYFTNQAQTCGKCHAAEAADLNASVHGKAIALGRRDAPTCTDCHDDGGHNFRSLAKATTLKISQTCSRCHASVYLDKKYNLPANRVTTYMGSYHGLAARNGSTVVADCASCHGYHKILPTADPASTINPKNLLATCGKCHTGANQTFVSGKIHEDSTAAAARDLSGKINHWVRAIYLVLIIVTIGLMFLHNALLFARKVIAHLRAKGDRAILRMSRQYRWQHALLALSFIILALTGFALKFPDSWLAVIFGSETTRRLIHRSAAIVMILVGLYHIIHCFVTKEGRQLLRGIFPRVKDLTDLAHATLHLLNLRKDHPKFGRFGYAEKMEYWAVVWGTIIMGITGFLLWFQVEAAQYLPRWVLDVALTIHYYEAVLACLAIIVWHFYHVIFDPDVYPINTACVDGRVTEEWQHHEHPLDTESPRANTRDAGAAGASDGKK